MRKKMSFAGASAADVAMQRLLERERSTRRASDSATAKITLKPVKLSEEWLNVDPLNEQPAITTSVANHCAPPPPPQPDPTPPPKNVPMRPSNRHPGALTSSTLGEELDYVDVESIYGATGPTRLSGAVAVDATTRRESRTRSPVPSTAPDGEVHELTNMAPPTAGLLIRNTMITDVADAPRKSSRTNLTAARNLSRDEVRTRRHWAGT